MQGVMFNDKHSYWEWGLMFRSRPVISPPDPKTKYVDVLGMDGLLDMTDTMTGYTQYNNRTITFEFVIMADRTFWPAIYSDLLDTLHGNVVDIVFDDDPGYAYKGRVTVGEWDAEKVTANISMTAEVEPFKTERHSNPAYKGLTVTESLTVMIPGTRKPSVPGITVSSDMQLDFRGNTYTLTAGENHIPDIIIRQGENTLVFTGDGTVDIDYRGGRF